MGAARILELRKLNGKQRVLRHSVHTCDASHCMAVIAPLVERAGWWLPDRLRAPLLVPVLSLGRCMAATEGSGAQAGSCSLAVADREAAAGRCCARPTCRQSCFRRQRWSMEAVSKDLMDMKVAELKEELEARDELGTS